MKEFTKHLWAFKSNCEKRDIDQAFVAEMEGSQLGQHTLYDLLHRAHALTSDSIVKEVEQMLGSDVVEVIQKSKRMTLQQEQFQSGLQTASFRVKHSLRLVSADDFEKIDKIKQMSSEKQAVMAQMERDITELVKENKDLKP